ncbi:MAG: Hsp70 family protein, partial [Myxococcales bacterium]|nr:Hsp70 family protein [Myxococcales bacterium]
MVDANIVLGIDLGTTNSACAIVQEGRASVVRRGEDRIVPSVVAALRNGELVVGREAKAQRAIDPSQVVYSAKRLIGRRFSSPEVQRMMRSVPYRIVEGDNEAVMIEVGGRRLSVVELSSVILRYLRDMAEEALGGRVKKTVIAVPANFTDSQRSATRIAARLAGLDVIRVINEPTAAALAYGYIEDMDRRIAVYDFGGGTFDVTILQITRNVFEVLSTGGDSALGGDDFDRALAAWLLEQAGFSPERMPSPAQRQEVNLAARWAKEVLSDKDSVSISLARCGLGPTEVGREHFDALIQPLVRKTIRAARATLKDAGVEADELDGVVLVGGSTRVPAVRAAVAKAFGR